MRRNGPCDHELVLPYECRRGDRDFYFRADSGLYLLICDGCLPFVEPYLRGLIRDVTREEYEIARIMGS